MALSPRRESRLRGRPGRGSWVRASSPKLWSADAQVLSPATSCSPRELRGRRGPAYEPANRLLIDPVLQFQPWLEFNRAMLRSGRLPTWNPMAGCGAPHLANGQSAVFDPFHLIAYLGELPDALRAGWRRPGSGSPAWGCSSWRGPGASAPGGDGSRA